MRGFIVVTDKIDGVKMLIPLSGIRRVFESDDEKAFIEMGFNNRGESIGVYALETFYSVVRDVAAASGGDIVPVCPNNEFRKLKGV